MRNQDFSKALLKILPDSLYLYDLNGVCYNFVDSSLETIFTKEVSNNLLHYAKITLDSKQIQTYEYQLEEQYFEARIVNYDQEKVLAIVRNITQQKKTEAQLKLDPLTKLHNRATFTERLDLLLTQAYRNNACFSVFLLDLDHFKDINDSLGHPIGDKLLIKVAERLENSIRKSDLAARLGGDEFALIQYGIKNNHDCVLLAEKLLNLISQPYEIDGYKIVIGTSIGIAVYPHDGITSEDLIRHADLALYKAKGAGRKVFAFFEQALQQEVLQKRTLEKEILQGIEKKEFQLYLQPIINAQTAKIDCAEALIRWQHPTRGILSPAEFLPLAEERGLINALTYYVFEEACKIIVRLTSQKINLPVAINLPGSLFIEDFTAKILNTLDRYGVAPAKFILEITESTAMKDVLKTQIIMDTLHQYGFQFSIDDFGTGYSSLSYLQKFQFDKLKIDRSFVTRLPTENSNVVRTILHLAQTFGMKTIAEGVETEKQLQYLKDIACDSIQGYFYSKPLPLDQFLKLPNF